MSLLSELDPSAVLATGDSLRASFVEELEQVDRTARAVQALAPEPVALDGVTVAGVTVPVDVAGGDLLDWHADDTAVTVTVADVMGDGVAAAILGAGLRSALRARIDLAPADAVAGLEAQIAPEMRRAETFATVAHARVDGRTGEVELVDAGHGIVMVVRADGGVDVLRTRDVPVGMQPTGRARFVQRFVLGHGDALIVATDGLLDLGDGTLGVLDAVAARYRGAVCPASFVADLRAAVLDGRPEDDVTVVVVARD